MTEKLAESLRRRFDRLAVLETDQGLYEWLAGYWHDAAHGQHARAQCDLDKRLVKLYRRQRKLEGDQDQQGKEKEGKVGQ